MFNWHTLSVHNPVSPPPLVSLLSFCTCLVCGLSTFSPRVSVLLSSSAAYSASGRSSRPPPYVSNRMSLLSSGVRPTYTNNRVPVLQRCGGQREPLSPGHGAREGVRSGIQGLKDGTRKGMRESEGDHCAPPTLTPAKGYHEEKACPGFGPTRKRPLGLKAEQEDTEREEGDVVSHPEKRAKFSTGKNFMSMALPFSSNYLFSLLVCFL